MVSTRFLQPKCLQSVFFFFSLFFELIFFSFSLFLLNLLLSIFLISKVFVIQSFGQLHFHFFLFTNLFSLFFCIIHLIFKFIYFTDLCASLLFYFYKVFINLYCLFIYFFLWFSYLFVPFFFFLFLLFCFYLIRLSFPWPWN